MTKLYNKYELEEKIAWLLENYDCIEKLWKKQPSWRLYHGGKEVVLLIEKDLINKSKEKLAEIIEEKIMWSRFKKVFTLKH